LFESITGTLPFGAGKAYDYVRHLLSRRATPMLDVAPRAPVDLARLVDQCLDPTPAMRPESAVVVGRELKNVLDALSSPDGAAEFVGSRRSSGRLAFMAGAAALAVAASVWWARTRDAADPIWRSYPFATAPSEQSSSRISPDGRWISFLSSIGDERQLLVKRI